MTSHSPAVISYQELLSNGQGITNPSPIWMAWSCVDLVQTVTAAVSQFMSTVVLPTPDASIGQSPPHSLTHRFSPALLPLCSLSLDGWGMVVEMQMFSLGLSTQYSLLSSCYIFLVHPSILCFRVSQLHSLRGQYLIMSCFGEIFWAHEQFFIDVLSAHCLSLAFVMQIILPPYLCFLYSS